MYDCFLKLLSQLRGKHIKVVNRLLVKLKHAPEAPPLKNLEDLADQAASTEVDKWDTILFGQDRPEDRDLTALELIQRMQAENKTSDVGVNAAIAKFIESSESSEPSQVCQVLKLVGYQWSKKDNCHVLDLKHNLQTFHGDSWASKNICDWRKEDITAWAKKTQSEQQLDIRKLSLDGDVRQLSDVLSVLAHATQLFQGFAPRVTQMMAVMLLLSGKRTGMLANISTGEGKTLITVMLATVLGLCGKSVDVLTSSKVLAIRDSKSRDLETGEGHRDFFEYFNLTCSNNCDDECDGSEEERQKRYADSQIMYGEAGCFERDILLTNFFGRGIRPGSGIADALILDEVDSMMLDNATTTLYISHRITDMRHLRDLFLRIWAAVNGQERAYTEDNVRKIIKQLGGFNNSFDPHSFPQTACVHSYLCSLEGEDTP